MHGGHYTRIISGYNMFAIGSRKKVISKYLLDYKIIGPGSKFCYILMSVTNHKFVPQYFLSCLSDVRFVIVL